MVSSVSINIISCVNILNTETGVTDIFHALSCEQHSVRRRCVRDFVPRINVFNRSVPFTKSRPYHLVNCSISFAKS